MPNEDNTELKKEITRDPLSPVMIGLFFELGLALVAIVLGLVVGPWPWPGSGNSDFRSLGLSIQLGVLGLLASIPPFAIALVAYRYGGQLVQRLEQQSQSALGCIICNFPIWQLLLLSMAAGLGEELLFRGWFQRGLESWLAGLVSLNMLAGASILIASLIFGICHALSLSYAVLAGIAGLYFGVLMLSTDGIECPIMAHASYDFLMMLWMRRRWKSTLVACK